MARIRSVKPQLRTSLTVAEWPREVRYFWVLLWGYLDDHGRGVDDARLIKADCFPLDDDLNRAVIDDWLTLIAKTPDDEGDLPTLCRYEVRGRRFVHAPKWTGHQRPQHPKDSELPGCPLHDGGEGSGAFHEASPEPSGTPRADAEKSSRSPHEDPTPEVEVYREVEVERGEVLAPPLTSFGGPPREPAEPPEPVPKPAERPKPPDAQKGTRLPPGFCATPEMIEWARLATPLVGARETEAFVDYWLGVAGARGVKRDWTATWRNWMRRAQADAERHRRAPPPVARPSTTDQRVSDALQLAAEFREDAGKEIMP